MKSYIVTVEKTLTYEMEVLAETELEAKLTAETLIDSTDSPALLDNTEEVGYATEAVHAEFKEDLTRLYNDLKGD